MIPNVTYFDGFVFIILTISTLMALARGFMRELATLGAFIAAIVGAYTVNLLLHDPVAALFPVYVPSWVATIILFLGSFLIIYFIVSWIGANLSRTIQGVDGISIYDRIAGAIFGLLRGAFVLIVFVYLLNLTMDKDQIPEFVTQALSYPALSNIVGLVSGHIPETLDPPVN